MIGEHNIENDMCLKQTGFALSHSSTEVAYIILDTNIITLFKRRNTPTDWAMSAMSLTKSVFLRIGYIALSWKPDMTAWFVGNVELYRASHVPGGD